MSAFSTMDLQKVSVITFTFFPLYVKVWGHSSSLSGKLKFREPSSTADDGITGNPRYSVGFVVCDFAPDS
jgi:hypothetical protein